MPVDIGEIRKLPINLEIMLRDVNEINICHLNRAYKATMVLCGSVLEYLLGECLSLEAEAYIQELERLVNNGDINVGRRDMPIEINELTLYERLLVSRRLRILNREGYRLGDLLRDYRNLIHPSLEIRTEITPDEARSNRSINALNIAIQNILRKYRSRDIYVINIDNIEGHWILHKDQVRIGVNNIARSRGLTVIEIVNEDQLFELIQNPPNLAIIINTHGERMYMPSQWEGDWREYFHKIGLNVRDHGWLFVSIAGYPFFYYGATENEVSGTEGLNNLLSVVNARANCMTSSPRMRFTQEGSNVLREFDLAGLTHQLAVQRCAVWENIEPYVTFLSDGNLCGASAIRIGRGFFIHIGLDDIFAGMFIERRELGARILGGLGAAFSLYTLR